MATKKQVEEVIEPVEAIEHVEVIDIQSQIIALRQQIKECSDSQEQEALIYKLSEFEQQLVAE